MDDMAKLILMGGEKDGQGQDGELTMSVQDCPNVFYATPLIDEERVRQCKGLAAKRELRDKLAILAYAWDREASTPEVCVMRRTPALDRVCQDG